jgi:hypothetical protein
MAGAGSLGAETRQASIQSRRRGVPEVPAGKRAGVAVKIILFLSKALDLVSEPDLPASDGKKRY